jgi:hypothetical protein
VPEGVINTARIEGVHLLLADSLHIESLANELRAAAVLEALRANELRRVLTVLADTGIRAILLKGAALAQTHYRRPELRPRSDSDLMIPANAREDVIRALVPSGYHRAHEIDGELAVGQFHLVKTDADGLQHVLDVHWRVSNVLAFAATLTYDELFRDAIAVPSLGPSALSACTIHALLIACVHRVAHHGDTSNLLWLYDVHLLARALTPADGEAFAALAVERRMRAVCVRTLTLAQNAFGTIDEEWAHSLASEDATYEPSAAFVGGGMRRADILKSDLAATAWTNRFQLLREHLFPPQSYMRYRYPHCPVLLLPFAYASRIVAGAPRWLRR